MHNLIIAVLCSVAVSILLKVARKRNIVIHQAIAFNYIVALSLSWFLLKPDFKGLVSIGYFITKRVYYYVQSRGICRYCTF